MGIRVWGRVGCSARAGLGVVLGSAIKFAMSVRIRIGVRGRVRNRLSVVVRVQGQGEDRSA